MSSNTNVRTQPSESTFNNDLWRLLNIYSSQYESLQRHIVVCQTELTNIRNDMNSVVQLITNLNNYNRRNNSTRATRNNASRDFTDWASRYNRVDIQQQSTSDLSEMVRPVIQQVIQQYAQRNVGRSDFFNNVVVAPTETEITNATRVVEYANILNPVNQTCPISLERFGDTDQVMQIRFCGHLFNPTELRSWFRENVRCPVCRYDIRNYRRGDSSSTNPVPSSNTTNNSISTTGVEAPRATVVDASGATVVDASGNSHIGYTVYNSLLSNANPNIRVDNLSYSYDDIIGNDYVSFDISTNNPQISYEDLINFFRSSTRNS